MTVPELSLRTPRLCLIASTLKHIEAELQDPQALGALLHAEIPASWPPGEYDRDALEFFRDRLLAGGDSAVGWYGWYVLTCAALGARRCLVAGAGYLGPPALGSVEVGYSVIPEARARGYAVELLGALVSHAFQQPEVQFITANTADSNLASTRVLLRCGFTRAGPGREPGLIEYRLSRRDG